jgi:thioester reductase-like protein
MDRTKTEAFLRRLSQTVDLPSEATAALPADVGGRGGPPASPPRHVVLTGATGYLGRFLAKALLRQGVSALHCLVRARDDADAMARVRAALDAFDLWEPGFERRVLASAADVSRSRLALAEGPYRRLADEADAIVHCAANVNLFFPYASLRRANVQGTVEALRLASTGAAKAFHFVSTVAALLAPDAGARRILEDDPLPTSPLPRHGYPQSKWVAESLVRAAGLRGVPFTIYRPAVIGWHSRTGAFNAKDFVTALVDNVIATRLAPALDLVADVVPVDGVAGAIAALATARPAEGRTYHLVSPSPPSWDGVVAALSECGVAARRCSYEEWRSALSGDPRAPLRPFLGMLPEVEGDLGSIVADTLGQAAYPTFDTARLRADLPEDVTPLPALDARLLAPHVRHYTCAAGVG